jgi:predicted TIM-barrel fold metal-dependent hydrolase
MLDRVDVHQHLIPPTWKVALDARRMGNPGWPMPTWSPTEAISRMDARHIATSVTSISAPGVVLGGACEQDSRLLCRALNDYSAELAKDRPDRFGFFASLPLPDVDGALAELTRSFDELRADGVVLLSHVRGRYLCDPDYDALWAELDRRAAVVFVHPSQPPPSLLAEPPALLADFVFDSTRSALGLALRGIPRRYPRAKVILAHGGGLLPSAVRRFATAPRQAPAGPASFRSEQLLADLRWFYFDTALTGTPSNLSALLAFAKPGHVLYGSDWPFAPAEVGRRFDRFGLTGLSGDARHQINRGAAERLFPRMACVAA